MSNIMDHQPRETDTVCEAILAPFKNQPRVESATSTAQAKELVASWTGKEFAAKPDAPILFLIEGNGYVHDGNSMVALNRVEIAKDYYENSQKDYSVGEAEYSGMIHSSLPARPWARVARVEASAWGNVKTGEMNLLIMRGDTRLGGGRFPHGTDSTVTVSDTIIIPAGEAPNISMGIYSSHQQGKITLSPAKTLTKLTVTATPYAG